MHRYLGYILAVLTTAAAALAQADPITITDMADRQVAVAAVPRRIVCLGPGALRLIVYLQATGRVVGVEDLEKQHPGGRPYRHAHPELVALPRCGPGGPVSINKKPDLEALLAVRPQVIFVTYMDAPLADEVQSILGIPVVVLSYGAFATFDTAVYDALRIAGRVLDRENRAAAVIAYIESLRRDLDTRTRTIPAEEKPGVYVGGIGYRGAHGIESTEKAYIPFDWVHARNMVQAVESQLGSHLFVDKEVLLGLDPAVIFIDGGGYQLVAEDLRRKSDYYGALTAFQKGRVYCLLPFNWYTTNIGTALADAYAIGKTLHPRHFEDVDLAAKADEIYTFLVGRPVYAQMVSDYGALGKPAPLLKAVE
jgi:iron complex transport system substrate-binding protein